ncbi:MAG: sugar phosphate isomerase/epimerase [Clostridia bacterium]|nr:sugar phosphate isomerase/epimerase [Clostridia bacterium]
MEFGLNLYSIRKLIATEESFLETAKKLKDMGYSFMQFSGAPFDAQKIKRVSDESGLPVVLTHVDIDRILNDTDKLIEEHNYFGCKNIGLGGMKNGVMKDDKTWKETLDKLNVVAEKIEKAGSKFFFHQHHYEFHAFEDGTLAFDYMLKNCPNINFTLDSYWIQYGGFNPLTFVDKVKGKMECVHLKDYRINRTITEEGKVELRPKYAPCGCGNMEFLPIIEKWKECGTKYFIVEQDDASTYPDPLGQVKLSIDYLKSL